MELWRAVETRNGSEDAQIGALAGLQTRVGNGILFRKNSAEQTRNGFRYSAEESAHLEQNLQEKIFI